MDSTTCDSLEENSQKKRRCTKESDVHWDFVGLVCDLKASFCFDLRKRAL